MNNLAGARYAAPLNSHAQLSYLHARGDKHEATSQPSVTVERPRKSSSGKFVLKMQSLFGGNKEARQHHQKQQQQQQQQHQDENEEAKKSMMRRLIGNDAMLQAGRARFGRP